MAVVQAVGQPENDSEALAIRRLGESLPEDWLVIHNFEVCTGRGLPYEYDVVVVGDWAVYHVEVKGYRGQIHGDARQWTLDNGAVYPSPIPLANKKSKILRERLEHADASLRDVFVETVILLSDDRARVKVSDPQSRRILRIDGVEPALRDPAWLPVKTDSIARHRISIGRALVDFKPSRKVSRIGLYDVVAKISQHDNRTVFLANHRHVRTRPATVLRVHHFDPYAPEEHRRRQIDGIFHHQDAMRLLGAHPNVIRSGDVFAWEDNLFVEPTEYVEDGRTLAGLIDRAAGEPMTWERKVDVVRKAAEGLRHCHSQGVIHRDLSPLHVVANAAGVVKIVGFDLARLEGHEDFADPDELRRRIDNRYVAPEAWNVPADADAQSDIYSLGVVFYELVTGKHPYGDVDEVLESEKVEFRTGSIQKAIEVPGSPAPGARPKDVKEVIARMCAFHREMRYRSMDQVMEDLALLA
jgi:serine/threonine protein kinase